MAVKTFAAIDVGSYEMSMKIFQFGTGGEMKQIDHIRHRLDLGSQTYANGKLTNEKVSEICRVLKEFKDVMKSYRVEDYKAYGTSAIRETENTLILLEQIHARTGIKIEVLSNSEQRFLDYKSIASKGDKFNNIITKGTAIVDIGGGSLQISLFDKDMLVSTQNIRLGILRIRDMLQRLQPRRVQLEDMMQELIGPQLENFKKLYLKDNEIHNIIVVDDYVSLILQKNVMGISKPGFIDTESFEAFFKDIINKPDGELSSLLSIEAENVPLVSIASVLVMLLIRMLGAKLLWAPGVTLCDGIAFEYAEKHRKGVQVHDFEKDILACATNISSRYSGDIEGREKVAEIALSIYDAMKKIHGLSKRERLLLQIASLLQDCGQYISLSNAGSCSYNIILSTEIIGLSHREREMVANIVQYVYDEFKYYSEIGNTTTLDRDTYLVITKLTAILRLSNCFNEKSSGNFSKVTLDMKDNELLLSVKDKSDILLREGIFDAKAEFFEEVFSIRPVIKSRKGDF